jgi:hypothetical protein
MGRAEVVRRVSDGWVGGRCACHAMLRVATPSCGAWEDQLTRGQLSTCTSM